MNRRLWALILALTMATGLCAGALASDYLSLLRQVRTRVPSFVGKTVILHTNDVHGAIDGYAAVAGLRDQITAWGATDVLLVDAGDFSQGELYVDYSDGASAIDMMNATGYDIAVPGNHDFHYGYDRLMENLGNATFSTICANIRLDGTHELVFAPSCVVETAGGLKIGFVGIDTPETTTKVNPNMVSQLSFASGDLMYRDAQEAVDAIRDECDLVILLTHLGVSEESAASGNRSVDLLNHMEGVDFTIDGHSHTVMTESLDGTPIQSAGASLTYIGVAVIDDATRALEDHYLLRASEQPRNEEIDAKVQAIIDEIDEIYNSNFAVSEVWLNGERAPGNRTEETNMGDLVTDALIWSVVREGGLEQVESDRIVGVVNGGGIRASIDAGDITMKDVNTALPFGNTIAVVYVTGEDLLEALEASTFSSPDPIGGFPQTSGIEWTLDTTKPYDAGEVYTLNGKETAYSRPASIQRVTIDAVNGKPFDPDATYAVVTNDFAAAGGDTYNVFSRAYSQGASFDTGILQDDAVVDYIADVLNGRITAEAYGEPRGSLTVITVEADSAADADVEPAA